MEEEIVKTVIVLVQTIRINDKEMETSYKLKKHYIQMFIVLYNLILFIHKRMSKYP